MHSVESGNRDFNLVEGCAGRLSARLTPTRRWQEPIAEKKGLSELVHFLLAVLTQREGRSMDSALMPAGATTMIEIIAVTAVAATGFAIWLWRQHRRLQSPTPGIGRDR